MAEQTTARPPYPKHAKVGVDLLKRLKVSRKRRRIVSDDEVKTQVSKSVWRGGVIDHCYLVDRELGVGHIDS